MDKKKLTDEARAYVESELIDYGDLNRQAEKQIYNAFIAGARMVLDMKLDELKKLGNETY